MAEKSFAQKIQSAQRIVGGIPNLFADLRAHGAHTSITSLYRWVNDDGEPHPNHRTIVGKALDEILAEKTGK